MRSSARSPSTAWRMRWPSTSRLKRVGTPAGRSADAQSAKAQASLAGGRWLRRPARRRPRRRPPPEVAVMAAREAATSAKSLDELRALLENFQGCALRATATQLVFADGNPQGRVMFVGEAPGYEEDMTGKPFVGRSGKLLDRMMAAIGLDRSKAYIANVVPWRPPGNRTPTPQETAICLPFIRRQIELADPDILVCLGQPATQTLLGTREGITRTRGRWFKYDTGSARNPRHRHAPPGLSLAPAAAEAPRLARFSGDQEGAGGQSRRQPTANLMAKMSASTSTAGLASANLPAMSLASA